MLKKWNAYDDKTSFVLVFQCSVSPRNMRVVMLDCDVSLKWCSPLEVTFGEPTIASYIPPGRCIYKSILYISALVIWSIGKARRKNSTLSNSSITTWHLTGRLCQVNLWFEGEFIETMGTYICEINDCNNNLIIKIVAYMFLFTSIHVAAERLNTSDIWKHPSCQNGITVVFVWRPRVLMRW